MEEIINEDNRRFGRDLKIIIVGNISTGKTSIINRYIKEEFEVKCRATIGPSLSCKVVKINGVVFRVHFWDLPGQDRNQMVSNVFCRDTDGIIFCCEVNDDKSLNDIKKWRESLDSNIEIEEIPKIILENKCDLLGDEKKYNDNMEELKKITEEYHFSKCFRTSALNGYNIDNAMKYLVKEIADKVDKEDIESYRGNISANTTITLDKKPYSNENRRCC